MISSLAESDATGIPPIVTVINTTKIPVLAYVFFLIAVGVALSVACLIFNIVFRNRKYHNNNFLCLTSYVLTLLPSC